ncbi:MAG: TIGR04053 family radical SAM/SPASM domain-containing protein [Armatimonadota bacterium]|nr:TIGR04053 family radical SAM/SPASM domain-containing protein [Armatimonadota bacterium]
MTTRDLAAADHRTGAFVFARAPVMLYWEVTQACDLACRHCRADAMPDRHPQELDTAAARTFLAQIRDFGEPLPHLVITGGDPLKRPDLDDLIAHARELGLPVSLAPSATPLLTPQRLRRLREAGIMGLSLSLDGATAGRHDAVRGLSGTFDHTLALARAATTLGLPLQVNTLVSTETLADLPALFDLVRSLRVHRWSLFLLIEVGRGRLLRGITPAQAETLCHWVVTRAQEAPFAIAATEAPFYRRVAVQRLRRAGAGDRTIATTPVGRSFGIRDGNGIAFVSWRGDVAPSGFLPVRAGSVRHDSIVHLYRHAPLFVRLRDPDGFRGKCGYCPFRYLCGGSRARAFAHTGDYLASDPLCVYEPPPPAAQGDAG